MKIFIDFLWLNKHSQMDEIAFPKHKTLTFTRDFVEISSKAFTSTESSLFYRNKIKMEFLVRLLFVKIK